MTDITIVVAIGLVAFAASLMLAKSGTIDIARRCICAAVILFLAHGLFGVAITAPVSSGTAKTMGIAGLAWMTMAILGLAVRGAGRLIAERRSGPING